ncbi:S-adenosylmethionine:tRNA ribosyltransferase-isomerase, partial [Bacteroidota bacterium]
VIQARLIFYKATGARIEIFCLEPHEPYDYAKSFAEKKQSIWKCLVGNLKKWKNGYLEKKIQIDNKDYLIKIEQTGNEKDAVLIKFSWNGNISFAEVLDKAGATPIPPYLNRESENSDKERYQTIYSKNKGSVAAPTAGLHFTENVFESLTNNNIGKIELTLHIGAGTFKPVTSEHIGGHDMHAEKFIINKNTLEKLIKNKDRIISVGTTSLRTLESLYWIGRKILSGEINDCNNIFVDQWDPYRFTDQITTDEAFNAVQGLLIKNKADYLNATTKIIILPGYKFRLVKGLITNFHMPKSTLLMLVAAFIGDDWKKVYNYALDNKYRFLSYGDSSLLLPERGKTE